MTPEEIVRLNTNLQLAKSDKDRNWVFWFVLKGGDDEPWFAVERRETDGSAAWTKAFQAAKMKRTFVGTVDYDDNRFVLEGDGTATDKEIEVAFRERISKLDDL